MFTCCRSHEPVAILNKGTDEELRCEGYQRIYWKRVVYLVLCVISIGLVWIACHWMVKWKVLLTSSRCSLKKADLVLLEDESGKAYIAVVHRDVIGSSRKSNKDYATFKQKGCSVISDDGFIDDCGGGGRGGGGPAHFTTSELSEKCVVRYIEHRHLRYAWNEASQSFEMLRGIEKDTTCRDIIEKYSGFDSPARINRLTLYGMNKLVIDVMSYSKLLFQEVLNPFYVFQIFSIILWVWENYYIYAGCIFVISVISLTVELRETRKQQVMLRDTVTSEDIMVEVFVPGCENETIEVTSSLLVPGDLIHIPQRVFTIPCDVVLITGSVVVDEGMLTGESVPVTKTHLSDESHSEIYSPISHRKHTLFCGTKVLQTRFYENAKVKGVVVRTGYSTMKGELVRMILYPKPIKFSFYSDALKFVLFLGIVATGGFIYTFAFLTINEFAWIDLIPKALDVITIAVPPALPAAMTVGVIYAQARLKKQNIFCISPHRINLCGRLNCMCFDKTGTLTEEGLDLGVVVTVDRTEVCFKEPIRDPKTMPNDDPFVIGMATCHSLIYIAGNVGGDPLDLKMFESINWLLEEPGRGRQTYDSITPTIVKPITMEAYMLDDEKKHVTFEVAIIKQFTFDSIVQRMSVLVRMSSAGCISVFSKGSPEKISSICNQSTIPSNFSEVLRSYASKGYRVIALATKDLDESTNWHQAQRLTRDVVESNLDFLGFLILENKLKPETTPALRHLNEAGIKIVMVTGDNILTALCVARQCNVIKAGVRVIQVDALPPENGRRARITWHVEQQDANIDATHYRPDPMTRVESAPENFETVPLESVVTCGAASYQFAVTGRSYSVLCQHFPELLPRIVANGAVFARMTPEQKSSLVENLQSLGLTVGMCGDGANDCGALRTSHAGISLSQMEASVASPFTSKVDNISCVPLLIREGRGSLVTSFGVFKFMALYSIIQFVSVIILTSRFSKLTDPMFLYIDLFIITVLALTMGRTEPSLILTREAPRSRLASYSNLFGITVHVLIVVAFQVASIVYVMSQPWYENKRRKDMEIQTFDVTCIFGLSIFQYLIMALVFSKGPPFRKRVWTNYWFATSLVILTIVSVAIVISPWEVSFHVFGIKELPSLTFKLSLLIVSFSNFLLAVIFEDILFESNLYHSVTNKIFMKIFCRKEHTSAYKRVIKELDETPEWPPLSETTWSSANPSSWPPR